MELVVGHDMTTHGDDALCVAIEHALGSDLAIAVVHVLTQQDLDRTGELSADAKRRVAIEKAFPRVWQRISQVQERIGRDQEDLSIDVLVRVAAVHLVRSQERIALELLQVCVDHGGQRVFLGRKGRPDGVADHVLPRGELQTAAHPHVLVVKIDTAALDLPASDAVHAGPHQG